MVPIVVDDAGRVLASGDPGSKACRATRGTTPSAPAGSRGAREVDGPGRIKGRALSAGGRRRIEGARTVPSAPDRLRGTCGRVIAVLVARLNERRSRTVVNNYTRI